MVQIATPRAVDEKSTQGAKTEAPPNLLRALLAECFGTFALTFVAAGSEVINAVSGGKVEFTARYFAPGLMVMALIYAMGDVSGAHLNPAVTFAFALRRDFPWSRVILYWMVQMLGAVLAALLLRSQFGLQEKLGSNYPHQDVGSAFVMEIVLTTLLISVILGTSSRHAVIGANAAIAVGGTIAMCGFIGSNISGASMNPVRSLGPALVSGTLNDAWIYAVGPILGAVAAVILSLLLHGKENQSEKKAAQGEQE